MSSVKDKLLQVCKRCILKPASDPTPVPMSHVLVLGTQSMRILLFPLSIFLLMIFILILINLLFEKTNGVVLHILYIILCLMLIFHHFFILLSHLFILTLFPSPCHRLCQIQVGGLLCKKK